MSATPTPEALGRYRLLSRLATGGMAEVFLAEVAGPAGFQKSVVVKRIHEHLSAEPEFVEMFTNEARIAALFDHPNLVQIFELGESDGTYFIAMERVDGVNLRTLLLRAREQGTPVPYAHAARIIAQACAGLGFAHDLRKDGEPLRLVHRDISPDNIMVSRAGAVKVMDFGIAKASTQRHRTRVGTIKGKLSYMPPEQLAGEPLDRRADLYALGVTFYELLAGSRPFQGATDGELANAVHHQAPKPLRDARPDCPQALIDVIGRMLEKDPGRRYADCRDVERDLEAFLRDQPPVGQRELAELVASLVAPGEPPSAPTLTEPAPTLPDRGRARAPARSPVLRSALVAGLFVAGAAAVFAVQQDTGGDVRADDPDRLPRPTALGPRAGAPGTDPQAAPPAAPLADAAAPGSTVAGGGPAPAVEPPEVAAPSPPPAEAPAHRSRAVAKAPAPAAPKGTGESPAPPRSRSRGQASGFSEKFEAADANKDNRLDPREFASLRFEDRFETVDANHDGYLDRAEVARWLIGKLKHR